MQKGDEASPSIILAGRALLVKMLINLEPHGIFSTNFVYLFVDRHIRSFLTYTRVVVVYSACIRAR